MLIRRFPGNYTLQIPDCGPFNQILSALYPDYVVVCDSSSTIGSDERVDLLGANPISLKIPSSDLEAFKSSIARRLQLALSTGRNLIVVIERLPPQEFYTKGQAEIPGGGTKRRSIQNHPAFFDAVRGIINTRYEVRNLTLEHLSMQEQVDIFHTSALVIGQHGAGLANLVWMRTGTPVVEIRQDDNKEHFAKISEYKQLPYHPYFVDSDHPRIDTDRFKKWFNSVPGLASFVN